MSFAQLHDGFYLNEKVLSAGSVGAWMWAASIGYASHRLTDGFIPSVVLAQLCPDLDTKPRLKVASRLVDVGLWEVVPGGWQIHDYLKWNLSKAVILARREANLARVNKHRGNAPLHGEGNARVMRYNEQYSACDSARTSGVSNAPSSESSESSESSSGETTSLLSPVPTAQTTDPTALALTSPKPKAAKAPKAAKPPPPFTVAEAIAALASTAGQRFVAGEQSTWAKGWVIALAGHVRRFPSLTTWALVGEWLAAGGGPAAAPGVPWAASAALGDAVAHAQAWEGAGRPALIDGRGYPLRVVAAPEEPDPWEVARARFLGGAS